MKFKTGDKVRVVSNSNDIGHPAGSAGKIADVRSKPYPYTVHFDFQDMNDFYVESFAEYELELVSEVVVPEPVSEGSPFCFESYAIDIDMTQVRADSRYLLIQLRALPADAFQLLANAVNVVLETDEDKTPADLKIGDRVRVLEQQVECDPEERDGQPVGSVGTVDGIDLEADDNLTIEVRFDARNSWGSRNEWFQRNTLELVEVAKSVSTPAAQSEPQHPTRSKDMIGNRVVICGLGKQGDEWLGYGRIVGVSSRASDIHPIKVAKEGNLDRYEWFRSQDLELVVG